MGGWNWDQVDYDHVDFKYPWIEKFIKLAADYMGHVHADASTDAEANLVDLFKRRGCTDSDIFLIIKGAELLYKDRTSATPQKPAFKRVP